MSWMSWSASDEPMDVLSSTDKVAHHLTHQRERAIDLGLPAVAHDEDSTSTLVFLVTLPPTSTRHCGQWNQLFHFAAIQLKNSTDGIGIDLFILIPFVSVCMFDRFWQINFTSDEFLGIEPFRSTSRLVVPKHVLPCGTPYAGHIRDSAIRDVLGANVPK